MDSRTLEPDCANCLGLCCIAPTFSTGDRYAFDKAEGVRCRNLGAECRCEIHDHLAADGMQGCIDYTCYGAGQRLCQEVLPGVDWRNDLEQTELLFDTYFNLKALHEIMWFLSEMAARCPDAELRSQILDRVAEIDLAGNASAAEIRELDVSALAQRNRIWGELVEKAQVRFQAER